MVTTLIAFGPYILLLLSKIMNKDNPTIHEGLRIRKSKLQLIVLEVISTAIFACYHCWKRSVLIIRRGRPK